MVAWANNPFWSNACKSLWKWGLRLAAELCFFNCLSVHPKERERKVYPLNMVLHVELSANQTKKENNFGALRSCWALSNDFFTQWLTWGQSSGSLLFSINSMSVSYTPPSLNVNYRKRHGCSGSGQSSIPHRGHTPHSLQPVADTSIQRSLAGEKLSFQPLRLISVSCSHCCFQWFVSALHWYK